MNTWTNPSYEIFAQWGDRAETPTALARRFLRTIDALSVLHPLLAEWTWGDSKEVWETEGQGGAYPFASIRPNIVRAIEANVHTYKDGRQDALEGYLMMASATLTDKPTEVGMGISAGQSPLYPRTFSAFCNYANYRVGHEPDPSLVTYEMWRDVLLVLSETWEVSWAYLEPDRLRQFWSARMFRCAWMSYLSPRFAARVTPPATAIVDYRPNGGLFLAATNEQFSVDNPDHVAAARDIETTLRPLDEMPYPLDEPYDA